MGATFCKAVLLFCCVAVSVLRPSECNSIAAGSAFRPVHESFWIAYGQNVPAESCNVSGSIRKNVVVFDDSTQIDKLPPSLSVEDVLWRDSGSRRGGSKSTVQFLERPQVPAPILQAKMREVIICWQRAVTNLAFNIMPPADCRSASAVFPSGLEPPTVFTIGHWDPECGHAHRINRSSFVCYKAFFGQGSLPVSGYGKYDCEYGYNHGRQGVYSGVVRVDELSRAFESNRLTLRERHREVGRTFYIGLIMIVFALIAYAFLK